MKTNKYLFILAIAAAALHAEDFANTTALKQTSLTKGFTQANLPVLHRVAGASQAQVSADLASLKGENTTLTISADGTAADFRNLNVAAKAHSLAKPVEQKLSQAALEQAGRAFIASNLANVITLGPGEQMVALSTDYRIEGEQNLATGAVKRAVAANRVVFGRTLNGVAVVGNGSTVVVTFANDGSVESFHYDWPKYEAAAGVGQNMANATSLLARVQQVVGARTGVTPTFTVHVPAANTGDLEINTGTKLQSLQCGYYDPGAGSGYAQVQPGCVYHAVITDTTGTRQGYSGAVPGGQQFQADTKWPESQVIK